MLAFLAKVSTWQSEEPTTQLAMASLMPAPQIPDISLETCGWYYLYETGFLTVAGCSSVWLDSNENWTCGRFKLCLAIKLDPTVCSSAPVVIRVNASHFSCQHAIDYLVYRSIIKHNPWRMTVCAAVEMQMKSLYINRNLLWYIYCFFFSTACSLTLENTLYAIKHWFEVKNRLFVDIIFYTLCWN